MQPLHHYKLSAELLGHGSDVRTVCTLPNGFICTGSRDRSIRVWDPTSPAVAVRTIYAHEHYLASLTQLVPSSTNSGQLFASGGNDKVIFVWDAQAITPEQSNNNSETISDVHPNFTLIGHSDTVCALATTIDGGIISGSWDKTARIWREGNCVQELKGHEQAVWAVLGLPNGDIVTGSADRTIKVWRGPDGHMQCVATLQKHTDCVRGLAFLPGIGFVSCGNDGMIILWSLSGEVLQELPGHTAFVYSVAVLPDSRIVTCGEDRTVKIWEGGECIQTLVHPTTVWSVATLSNGDVVSGGSDGIARIWTRDAARIADTNVLEAYDKALAATEIHSKTVGDVQLDKLPTLDSLAQPGKKDGENKIVRVGNGAEAYTWSNNENKWIKIGEVVGSGPKGKQELFGKEYDYVFDVELDGGTKKIGYNMGENPYMAAQEFLWREELGQDYLEEIARFLIKNTSSDGSMVLESVNTIPGDPFTGRRTETKPSTQTSITGAVAVTTSKYIPQRSAVFFESSNLTGLFQKLEEFAVKDERTLLSDENRRAIPTLQTLLRDTSKYHASKFGYDHYQLVVRLVEWPAEYLFPVLDLLRVLFLHPNAAEVLVAPPNTFPGRHIDILQFLLNLLAKADNVTNSMLAIRTITNMFYVLLPRKLLENRAEEICQHINRAILDTRTVLPAATVALNYSVQSQGAGKNGAIKIMCLSLLKGLLVYLDQKKQAADVHNPPQTEMVVRVLVAVGTLIWQDQEAAQFAKATNMTALLQSVTQNMNDSVVKECMQELTLLKL